MVRKLPVIILAILVCCCAKNQAQEERKPVEDNPTVPSGVTRTGAGADFLEFRWDACSGADSYSYRLLKGVTQDREGSVNATTVRIDGLQAETTYNFEVKSLKNGKESGWSTRIEARTSKVTPPAPVDPDPIGTPDEIYKAMNMPAFQEDGVARAFPGAEGGGMSTTGGRGGRVLHVTNLSDDGKEGSLRWAVNQTGPRTVVFDVAGVISLGKRLEIKNGDLTIAGQTAPGDGICIKDCNTRIEADNVILRFLRFRMGDGKDSEDDALNCYSDRTPGNSNIIIDHCSLSWSTDECGTFYGVKDFTLQYCILSESLTVSIHGKGSHGYGGIWGGREAYFHHNLLAHHSSRNPRFDHDYVNTLKGPVHFYNNVVYNWRDNSAYGGEGGPGQSPKQVNFVCNYYKPGPATASNRRTRLLNPTTKCKNCNSGDERDVTPGKFYLSGNYMYGSAEVTADNWKGVKPDNDDPVDGLKSDKYFGTEPAYLQTAEEAYETVLASAGASLCRDKVDARVVKETKDGSYTYNGSKGSSKGIIDTQSDVGGWPEYKATEEQLARTVDTDGDGISDWYECLLGLDKRNPADAALFTIDYKAKRYSNLEMYLQYLVRDISY